MKKYLNFNLQRLPGVGTTQRVFFIVHDSLFLMAHSFKFQVFRTKSNNHQSKVQIIEDIYLDICRETLKQFESVDLLLKDSPTNIFATFDCVHFPQ
jgi:hypothetical protein